MKTIRKAYSMMNCYLGVCSRNRQEVKAELVLRGAYRVTDHDTYLKVLHVVEPSVDGFRCIKVEDKTKHWDETYWNFAMDAFRYAGSKGHDYKALDVTIHYLCNLFGVAETEYYSYLVEKRRFIDATFKDDDGTPSGYAWEIAELKKAGLI